MGIILYNVFTPWYIWYTATVDLEVPQIFHRFFKLVHITILYVTRKNCFRYLKLMSLLKNNYLTLRSKVKVPWRSWWYATHHLMVMHPHTKYHFDLSGKTKKLWSGQASLKRSGSGGRRKNQTKTICLPSFKGET